MENKKVLHKTLPLKELIQPHYKKKIILGIDPGEITGLCVYKGHKLIIAEEMKTFDLLTAGNLIGNYIKEYSPFLVVIEDFILYQHKLKDLAWNKVHTAKLIGCIVTEIQTNNRNTQNISKRVKIVVRNAQTMKNGITDIQMKEWGIYTTPKQNRDRFNLNKELMSDGGTHYRDAQKHCLYELMQGDGKQRVGITTTTDREKKVVDKMVAKDLDDRINSMISDLGI